MNQDEIARIKQLLLEGVADLAPHLFPNGKKEGNHWRVGSIEGEAGKSFDVCIAGQKAGLYGDFEKSEKHSNNLLDLWMQARNVDFKTALREAAEWLGLPQTKSKRTFPTLEDAIHAVRPPKMLVTRREAYRDANGIVRLVVVRFDGKEGKEFRPFHQTSDGWVIADPPGKLPLLDLPELVRQDLNRESSSETVFVPEGEKCVRELRDKLGLLATTSAHGAKAPYKTDWTPLVGRPVTREALRRSSCNSRRRQKLRSLNFQGCPKKEIASTGSRRATESHPSRSRQNCLS